MCKKLLWSVSIIFLVVLSQDVLGLQNGWYNQDIGAVSAAGSLNIVGGTYTVEGSGVDIWNTSDEFHYVYRPMSGDGYIQAYVSSVSSVIGSQGWTKGGVMIRETLDPGSKHAFMLMREQQLGSSYTYRFETNLDTAHDRRDAYKAPYWVKVTRSGNTFTGSVSSNGSSWTNIGSYTFPMATNVYVGLAVTAHSDGEICTAVFNNVSTSAPFAEIAEAGEPSPDDGAIDVSSGTVLSWTPGSYAADVNGHDVYLGMDFNDVNDATTSSDPNNVYQGAQNRDVNSFSLPGGLTCGKTYYWRIDEVNMPSVWTGDVWSFSVKCNSIVRDFANLTDFSAMADLWLVDDCREIASGIGSWCCGADVDKSGAVGPNDLAMLVGDWLNTDILDFGDLVIPTERLGDWGPGTEGGVPDTSSWPIYCDVTDSPYNAVADDGLSDRAAIQSAIDAAAGAGGNRIVYVPSGVYIGFDSNDALMMKSNVVLRGAGADVTTITGYPDVKPIALGGIKFYGQTPGPEINITSGSLPRGTTTITVTDGSGFTAGDYCYMVQYNDFSYYHTDPARLDDFYMAHIFKIESVNGNDIIMDQPLRHQFGTGFNPRVRKMNPVTNTGLEDMKVMCDELTSGQWLGGLNEYTGPVAMYRAINCWAKNVHFYNGHQYHLSSKYSGRNTITGCKFERLMWAEYGNPSTVPPMLDAPYDNYSVIFETGAVDNLITNSIFEDLYVEALFINGSSGNVFSYNYIVGSRSSDGIHFAGCYPHSNLIEGNDSDGAVTIDNWDGEQGPYNTVFRNRLRGTSGIITEDFTSLVYNPSKLTCDQLNVIGNISFSYHSSDRSCDYDAGACDDFDLYTTSLWAERNIYRDTRGVGYGLVVTSPEATTILLSNAGGDSAPVGWSAFDMPASLYLSSKPDFWPGGKSWPCIGADVDDFAGTLIKLPAQDRHEAP